MGILPYLAQFFSVNLAHIGDDKIKRILEMSNKLLDKLEKQEIHIELLEDELESVHAALAERSQFAASLERDLENLIVQMQNAKRRELNKSLC